MPAGEGVILDRSVYSDCVFARVCKREGFISTEGEITTCTCRLVSRLLFAPFSLVVSQFQTWHELCSTASIIHTLHSFSVSRVSTVPVLPAKGTGTPTNATHHDFSECFSPVLLWKNPQTSKSMYMYSITLYVVHYLWFSTVLLACFKIFQSAVPFFRLEHIPLSLSTSRYCTCPCWLSWLHLVKVASCRHLYTHAYPHYQSVGEVAGEQKCACWCVTLAFTGLWRWSVIGLPTEAAWGISGVYKVHEVGK